MVNHKLTRFLLLCLLATPAVAQSPVEKEMAKKYAEVRLENEFLETKLAIFAEKLENTERERDDARTWHRNLAKDYQELHENTNLIAFTLHKKFGWTFHQLDALFGRAKRTDFYIPHGATRSWSSKGAIERMMREGAEPISVPPRQPEPKHD